MSKNTLIAAAMAAAVSSGQVLARALVEIEHDRELRIPGVKEGPNAETFLLPQTAFATLERAGCVERVGVIDTADILDGEPTAPTGPAVTFADVADMAAMDELKAQLHQAQTQLSDLAGELQAVTEQRDELREQVEQLQAGTDGAGNDQAGEGAADLPPADAEAAPTEEPAEAAPAVEQRKPAGKTGKARG